MDLIRPMLAAPTKEAELRATPMPKLASYKLDGIRALCRANPDTGNPEIVSRKLIKIPNKHVQRLFAHHYLIGLDGELCVGPTNAKNLMQATTSGVMTSEGEPDVTWQVFDNWDSNDIYVERAKEAKALVKWAHVAFDYGHSLSWLSQHRVDSYADLLEFEDEALSLGYEGVILRCPYAPYKQNRSTVKQGYLLKVKRFEDGEAEVIGYEEQQRNDNEATMDERGYTKRSTHKANKSDAGILGALCVKDCATGVTFSVGTGFTHEQRVNLWEGRRHLIGRVIKYKHFPIGVKDKPRFPTYVSFRDWRDM